MVPASDRELLEYFKARRIWRLEADASPRFVCASMFKDFKTNGRGFHLELTSLRQRLDCVQTGKARPAYSRQIFQPRALYIDLGICLILFIMGYIALFVSPEQTANLGITPDEVQYATSAYNLFTKGTYRVTLNHQDYSALYPYGFPLLLLPAFYLFGPFVGNVTYINFLLIIGTVTFTYLIGKKVGGRVTGCVAAFLLLGNRVFLHTGQHIFSQNAVTFLLLACTYLLLKLATNQEMRSSILLSGLTGMLVGFLPSVHLSSVCFFPAIFFSFFWCYKKQKGFCAIISSLVVAGILSLLIFPLLLYNKHLWGGYLKSGYEYWFDLPSEYFFSVDRILSFDTGLFFDALANQSMTRFQKFIESGNSVFYLSGLLGFDKLPFPKLYSPIVALLILAGLKQFLHQRDSAEHRLFVYFTALALGGLLCIFLPYYYQDFRFFSPILPFLLIIASVGAVSVGINFYAQGWTWRKRTILLCVGALLLADFGQTFFTKGVFRHSDDSWTLRYASAQTYNAVVEGNAVIVSALDPLYVSHFVLQGTSRTYLPLVRDIHYVARDPQKLNYHWRDLGLPVAADNPRVIADLLRAGLSVYADDLKEKNYNREYQKLRSLFDWQIVGEFAQYHIYRLSLKEASVGFLAERLEEPIGTSKGSPSERTTAHLTD